MCGFLFISEKNVNVNKSLADNLLSSFGWRGPDFSSSLCLCNNHIYLGHNRLSILGDNIEGAIQPIYSKDKRYVMIYNGEVYNHNKLRIQYNLSCITNCDSETIIEGFSHYSFDFLKKLEGMFALLIFDTKSNEFFIIRDSFGIKPLYYYYDESKFIVCSESFPISKYINDGYSEDSIKEWKIFRRPLPGQTFYNKVKELLPGKVLYSSKKITNFIDNFSNNINKKFDQKELEDILKLNIKDHELSDANITSFVSGGIDSTIILANSNISNSYTIGFKNNNEFNTTRITSKKLNKNINELLVDIEQYYDTLNFLVKLRNEPLTVPNEVLIYLMSKSIDKNEKVILTGEGADELVFGYDRIFRFCLNYRIDFTKEEFINDFVEIYKYSDSPITDRFYNYLYELSIDKSPIEFCEDFFISFHLLCLLRRMDYATMAASKEARVPFVNRALYSYLYRKDPSIKLNDTQSKIPLRNLLGKSYNYLLKNKKIGFSASFGKSVDKLTEYKNFHNLNLKILGIN